MLERNVDLCKDVCVYIMLPCFIRNYVTAVVLQDGFYNGILTDGRSGLVPSNFVRQLYGMLTIWWYHL